VIGTRNRSSSPLDLLLGAAVPPTHVVRMRSLYESDCVFMGIGLLGVRGPSLSELSTYWCRRHVAMLYLQLAGGASRAGQGR
jgi:hypothetical protein